MKYKYFAIVAAFMLAGVSLKADTVKVNGVEFDPADGNPHGVANGVACWHYDNNLGEVIFNTTGGIYVVEGATDASVELNFDNNPAVVVEVNEEGEGDTILYKNTRKIADRFFEVQYDWWDWELGQEFLNAMTEMSDDPEESGGCTSCWNGRFAGRNMDWSWEDSESFLIRMPANPAFDRPHASMGLAFGTWMYGEDENYEEARVWEWLPGMTLDGINDAGVYINVNMVATGSAGYTTGTNPTAERQVNVGFVVRYVLDHADSPAHAVELMRDVNIYSVVGQEFHWMIADTNECYIAECVSNKLVVVKSKPGGKLAAMSNFHITNSPHRDEYDIVSNAVLTSSEYLPWALGIERYDRATNGLAGISSRLAMHEHMRRNWFANGFYLNSDTGNHDWWSEYNGSSTDISDEMQSEVMAELGYGNDIVPFPGLEDEFWDTSVKEAEQDNPYQLGWWLNFAINKDKKNIRKCLDNEARTGSRLDPETGEYADFWQTVHSCAYDLQEQELSVMVQERYSRFYFKLSGDYGDWPYGESSVSEEGSGWKAPGDYDDIGDALNASGIDDERLGQIDLEGYEQLVRWSGSVGLEPSQLDDRIAEAGQNPLFCAAVNKLWSFPTVDQKYAVGVKIKECELSPSNATLYISADAPDLSTMNYSLLKAALDIEGTDRLENGFSTSALEGNNFSVVADEIVWTASPKIPNSTNFFYRVRSR